MDSKHQNSNFGYDDLSGFVYLFRSGDEVTCGEEDEAGGKVPGQVAADAVLALYLVQANTKKCYNVLLTIYYEIPMATG